MSGGRCWRKVHCLGVLALVVVAGQEATAQDLLLRWTFDEPAGGTVDAVDRGTVAPAANGVFGSTTTRTTDTPGGDSAFAADLSAAGADSDVRANDPDKIDSLTAFTLTTWVKIEAENVDQGGEANVRLLSKQGSDPLFEGFSWNLNDPVDGDRSPDDFRLGLFVGGTKGFDFFQSDDDVEGQGRKWTFPRRCI